MIRRTFWAVAAQQNPVSLGSLQTCVRNRMTYRRSKQRADTGREWRTFLELHYALVAAAALPEAILETRERWDDFLMHGYLDHHEDPSRFTVDMLSSAQLQAVRALAVVYFGDRGADYTPLAISQCGRERSR